MDLHGSCMFAIKALADARLKSRQSEENRSDTVETAPTASATISNKTPNPANITSRPVDHQVRLGSCVTARRRFGRTQRGQDPLSYKIGSLTFHTFRAMDPDKGCQCEPSQWPRCSRPCRKVLEMRKENYVNSLLLQSLPEDERRKLFRDRDPAAVLINRAYKYNSRFITEKTKSGRRYIFDETQRFDSVIQMMEETRQ
ncbi:hypothetical protein RP20_CCG001792 [Aedes albopictus]|nr:hypothetical protein RP20_CCG001792 [Aedes albopictus]